MRGDDEFVEFATAVSARLHHLAYLLTGNRHDAEDAAQAALVRTYAAWQRIRRRDPYAYTRVALTNLVTDRWRRPYREYATEEMPEPPAMADVAEVVTRRRWLIQALHQLAPRERAVIVLRHYLGLSEADTAQELNLPVGTVKSLNSRGLATLRVNGTAPGPSRQQKSGAPR